MANNEEHLNYVFGADISGFQNAIKSVEAGLKSTGQKLKDIGGDLSTYVSLPLAALGGAAIKAFGDIEALKNGLNTVTGSAKETEKQFSRLKEMAKMPSLGLAETVRGSINLQTIGFSAEKAEKAMRAFGNAIASVGKGKVEFEGALYGLQQLANTDVPLAEDLNIIKERLPQVTKILKEAFGTSRSEELAKMGVSSQQLVDTIIDGLGKLPIAAGGVNNAFENLKDGVFQNLAEIGEIINKNLDIAALSDKIVDGISSITQWFKELSPEVQKGILVFSGLAIVIPPILVGLGALIGTVLPALIAGFTALISPVGLVVAAIAAATVLIVKNWETVSNYFTSGEGSQFWNAVVKYASDLGDNLKSIFNTVKTSLITVWKSIGTNVIGSVSAAFDTIKGVISTVLGVISGYVKIFASVIKGDWSGVWDGVKDVTTALWNGIIGVLKGSILQAGNLLAAFFKMIGADSLAAGAENANNRIANMFNAIQIPVKKATETVKDFKKELLGVESSSTSTDKNETKNTVKGDSGAKDKIDQVYKDLEIGLKQIDTLFGASFDEKAKKRIDEYQQAINNLIKNGVDPASEAIKKLHQLQVDNVQLSFTKAKDVSAVMPLEKGEKPKEAKFDGSKRVGNMVKTISNQKIKVLQLMDEMNQGITDSLNNGVANVGVGFADMVGQMAAGTMTMGGVVQGLIGILADMAQQIGKIAISTGVAMIGIKAAFKNPFTAIAAGVALVALGAMVKGNIAKATGGGGDSGRVAFAKGGIVSGPTNAVFGEYPSAGRGNPEVVTPLNNLKGMLSDMGAGYGGDVTFRISGDALVGTLNNHDKRNYRTN